MQPETQTPLVSILMLTYNRSHFITESILSVLDQTYTNFELIIIDDGSTDDTSEIVLNIKDSRIHYIKDGKNLGLVVRRNESLSYARGQYVAVLDSDDIWNDRDKLAIQVSFLETNPNCAIVGSFITLMNERGEEFKSVKYCTSNICIRKNFLLRNQFAHSSVLMRKSILDKTTGYPKITVAEDLGLFLQLGIHGSLANIPKCMVKYRVHNGGESSNKLKIVSQVLEVIKLHRNNYPRYHLAWLKFTLYSILLKLKLL